MRIKNLHQWKKINESFGGSQLKDDWESVQEYQGLDENLFYIDPFNMNTSFTKWMVDYELELPELWELYLEWYEDSEIKKFLDLLPSLYTFIDEVYPYYPITEEWYHMDKKMISLGDLVPSVAYEPNGAGRICLQIDELEGIDDEFIENLEFDMEEEGSPEESYEPYNELAERIETVLDGLIQIEKTANKLIINETKDFGVFIHERYSEYYDNDYDLSN